MGVGLGWNCLKRTGDLRRNPAASEAYACTVVGVGVGGRGRVWLTCTMSSSMVCLIVPEKRRPMTQQNCVLSMIPGEG